MAEQHTLTVKVTGDSSQLVAALNRAQAELAELDRKSNQTSAGFDDIGRAGGVAGGMMASFAGNLASIGFTAAIQGAVQLGAELYNIGRASQVAGNTFAVLQGGAEQASASLAMLREATNFTVPDTTLMSISNLYTQMGLATDPAEVARLAQMGAELGMAMGHSAEEAMRTFSALLANQSIELLDQFGISSGQVRDRIKELQDANSGLAREQAFVTAVLEIGAVAQDRVNVAIEKNVSSVDKLTTRFQNLAAEVGKSMSIVVESTAQSIEGAISSVEQNFTDIEQAEQLIKDLQQTAYRFGMNVTLPKRYDFFGGIVGDRDSSYSVDKTINDIAELVVATGSLSGALQEYQDRLDRFGGRDEELLKIVDTLQKLVDVQNQLNMSSQYFSARAATSGYGFDFAIPAETLRIQQNAEATLRFAEQFANLEDAFDFVPLDLAKGIVSNQELERSAQLVDEINALIFEMLNASVSEDDPTIKTLQKMREELVGLSDDAIRARNEMSLTTALGLGLPPEQRLTADILTAAGIGGRQAEFLTGQRTISSEMFDAQVLPLIQAVGETFGEDEAAILGDRIADLMRQGIALGFENKPVQLMDYILGNIDYRYDEGQARTHKVKVGDTLSQIAVDYDLDEQFGSLTAAVQVLAQINKLEDPNNILTGSELIIEVGARVTRLLPPLLPTADEMGLDASTLGMIYGGQAPTNEDGEPVTPLGPTAMGIDETLATAQELQTLMSEIVPPVITPAKMGLVAGDVAEVGVVEVIDSIGQKLQDISSRIYQVSMTVNLDANIRTGAGFKIIPITMAEIANDISESARLFRLAQGAY